MGNEEVPACIRCHGRNWIDLGEIIPAEYESIEDSWVQTGPSVHLFQCGGGEAHIDANEIRNGCMRVIRATPEEMKAGGMI